MCSAGIYPCQGGIIMRKAELIHVPTRTRICHLSSARRCVLKLVWHVPQRPWQIRWRYMDYKKFRLDGHFLILDILAQKQNNNRYLRTRLTWRRPSWLWRSTAGGCHYLRIIGISFPRFVSYCIASPCFIGPPFIVRHDQHLGAFE